MYFNSSPYQEILRDIEAALKTSQGCVKLTGASGTGKSALCSQLFRKLEDQGELVLYYHSPPQSAKAFQAMIQQKLKLSDKTNFTRALTSYLLIKNQSAKTLTIIFDDAQDVDEGTYKIIRKLCNIQENSSSLVKLLLCGSQRLDQKLTTPGLRSIGLSINESFELKAMDLAQFSEFYQHWTLDNAVTGELLSDADLDNYYAQCQGLPGDAIALFSDPTALQHKAKSKKVLQTSRFFTVPTVAAIAVVVLIILGAYSFLNNEQDIPAQSIIEPAPAPATLATEVEPATEPAITIPQLAATQDNDEPDSVTATDPVDALVPMPTAEELSDELTLQLQTEPGISQELLVTVEESSQVDSTEIDEEEIIQIVAEDEAAVDAVLVQVPATEESVAVTVPPYSINNLLDDWTLAWGNQNMPDYFAAYHRNFSPANGQSLSDWQAARERNITRPASISLTMDRMEILEENEQTALVRFWLEYRSPTYADQTLKELRLEKENDAWKILSEENIEVNRI